MSDEMQALWAAFHAQEETLNRLERETVETCRLLGVEQDMRRRLDVKLADAVGRLVYYEQHVPAVAGAKRQYDALAKQRKQARRHGILTQG